MVQNTDQLQNQMPVIRSVPVSSKPFLAGNAIKTAVFALISIALVVGNFFLEDTMADGQNLPESTTIVDERGLIVEATDETSKPSFEKIKSEESNYLYRLNSGRIFSDFSVSSAKVNILADKVLVIPQNAVFEINFVENKLEINVFKGSVILGFLADGNLTDYQDIYSPLFINRLLVPRETQVIIPIKKVNEKIAPLLYSKLVKEFKYAAIPQSAKESEWAKQNFEKSNKFLESLRQGITTEILQRGSTVKDGFFNDLIFLSEEKLIFVPDKKEQKMFEHLFAYLDDAIFYANEGSKDKMEENKIAFENYLRTLPVSIQQGEVFHEKLDHYINTLRVFNSGDNQYEIYQYLIDKKLFPPRDIDEVMQFLWSDLDRSLDVSDVLAEKTFDFYRKAFEKTIDSYKDRDIFKTYLTYQNQLFDNLLLKYPLFDTNDYFSMKNSLEQDLLKTYENGQLKTELKQALVSNKLNFLKRLRQNLFEGKMEVKETRDVFEDLFPQIDELMPDDDVAVTKLFKEQFDDITDFWTYLKETSYHSITYGTTHKERYQFFLKDNDTILSLNDLRKDILGEVSGEELSVVEVVDEIEEFLKSNSDVTDLEVGAMDGTDQRYVDVKLILGGYPLKAVFDRNTETLKDVEVYGELVTDKPVKIGNLLGVLQEKFADLAEEVDKEGDKEGDGGEVTLEMISQKTAKVYMAKKISEFGFELTMDNVSIIDELDSVYRIEGAGLKGYKDLKVTFDMVMSEEITTNVFLIIKNAPKVIEGKYSLEELVEMIAEEYASTDENKEEVPSLVEEKVEENSLIEDFGTGSETGRVER